jgi:hypothetical protein
MAHIHIREAPTAGHIWRHAGLDPTCQWLGPEKTKAVVNTVATASVVSDEQVVALSALLGRNPAKVRDLLIRGAEKAHNPTAPTGKTAVITVLSKRPHNAKLKVITWKAGQSFLKMSGNEKCLYGHIYKERKALEWERNLRGDFREQAQRDLADKKYGAETTARPWYAGDYLGIDAKGDPIPATEKGAGTPMLSPAHIDARARRYAVKLFLSHLHEVMYWVEYQDLPPAPYIFRDLKHSHYIEVPNLNVVPGLQNAKEKAKGKEA